MPIRKESYWKRYPTSTLLKDVEGFELKGRIFRGENLKLSLTTGVRNKSEYNIVKKILEGRRSPQGYYNPY